MKISLLSRFKKVESYLDSLKPLEPIEVNIVVYKVSKGAKPIGFKTLPTGTVDAS